MTTTFECRIPDCVVCRWVGVCACGEETKLDDNADMWLCGGCGLDNHLQAPWNL